MMHQPITMQGEPVKRLSAIRDRERQRVDHLVLGRDRPPAKSIGKGKAKRRVPVALDPSVDAGLALREEHRDSGTPETMRAFAAKPGRPIERMRQSGTLTDEQAASAESIALVAEMIGRDVHVGSPSYEPRIDKAHRTSSILEERIGAVHREMAFTAWRNTLPLPRQAVLDVIVAGIGMKEAAAAHRIHERKMRRHLIEALDRWPTYLLAARREISSAELAAAHAGLI